MMTVSPKIDANVKDYSRILCKRLVDLKKSKRAEEQKLSYHQKYPHLLISIQILGNSRFRNYNMMVHSFC